MSSAHPYTCLPTHASKSTYPWASAAMRSCTSAYTTAVHACSETDCRPSCDRHLDTDVVTAAHSGSVLGLEVAIVARQVQGFFDKENAKARSDCKVRERSCAVSHCPSPFCSTSSSKIACCQTATGGSAHQPLPPHFQAPKPACKHVRKHTVPSPALPTFWCRLPAVAHVAVHITTRAATTTCTSASTR